MTGSRHPNKEIEHALQYAQTHGWRIVPGGSHAWGRFIALMMMKAVGAVSFALPVFGVRLKIQRVTPEPFDALSTTASSKSLEPN